jgi:triosephosphate isomerase
MYKNSGAKYTLIGHSERRHLFHETNHDVRQKMEAALSAGLIPVLCVGETEKEREDDKTKETIEIQIRSALHALSWNKNKKLIIAYEPVWAISKGISPQEAGKHCDYLEAQRIHKFIKNLVFQLSKDLELVILFGGSVRPNTVKEYLQQPDIDGVLVGAASTKLDSWIEIVHNAC